MSTHIPVSAGTSRIERRNVIIRGRKVRLASIVFTTHDGFVGEAPLRNGQFRDATRMAYEAAVAERASALFKASRGAEAPVPTSAWEQVHKHAPAAPLPMTVLIGTIKDTFLCDELEKRGYEILMPTA